MAHDRDIDWLLERRPSAEEPSSESTERARTALIAHGVRRRRARRQAGAICATAVLAAAAVVVVVSDGVGPGMRRTSPNLQIATAPPTTGRTTAARHLRQTPLVRLAADVRTLPAPRQHGDATLVVRDTFINGRHVIDGAVYGGYDLYTDSGKYYYAPDSIAQLQQTVSNNEVTPGLGNVARTLDSFAAAAGERPAQARAAALRTQPPKASRAQARRQFSTLPPAERRRYMRALFGHHSARQIRLSDDGSVYDQATEALTVGAGRPAVRAGALKALNTITGLTETPTRVYGIRALEVRFPDDGIPETIWLDALTGVPIEEKDGSASATSFVVERVTASHLPAHVSTIAQLR